jgi:hypothetical protein
LNLKITTVPNSQAHQGKDILKAKRASLADETFEMLKFMKGNKHHVAIVL